jgi:hypothetical protein
MIKYSPQTKEVAEHLKITFMGSVQINQIHCELPKLLWGAIAFPTIYVHNKSSVVLDEQLTPENMQNNKNRVIRFLRPIVCIAYNKTTDSKNVRSREKPVFVVEYSKELQSYRLYNPPKRCLDTVRM